VGADRKLSEKLQICHLRAMACSCGQTGKPKKVGISIVFSADETLFMAFDANITALFLLITMANKSSFSGFPQEILL